MRSVLETCKPRPEILAGHFNPEVFTASLSPIIDRSCAAISTCLCAPMPRPRG